MQGSKREGIEGILGIHHSTVRAGQVAVRRRVGSVEHGQGKTWNFGITFAVYLGINHGVEPLVGGYHLRGLFSSQVFLLQLSGQAMARDAT